MLEKIELPPLWLAVAAAAGWALATYLPILRFDLPYQVWAGRILIGFAVALMVWAAATMAARRTTVIPRRTASALVTGGPFAFSRNPIYLADALILIGLAVQWGAVSAFLPIPLFIWLIDRRFIRGEERMLAAEFGDAYADYRGRTRRWI